MKAIFGLAGVCMMVMAILYAINDDYAHATYDLLLSMWAFRYAEDKAP